jgi:polar amino acid transport system substrate-binding protein
MATKDAVTGELRGVAVDLARALAERIGVELSQVVYPRPGAIFEGLKSDAWDVAFLGIDPARSAEADFSPAYMEVDLTYLVPETSPIHNINDVDKAGVRVAVPAGDLVDIVLGRMLRQAELVRAETVANVFELFKAGKADVCALPRPNLLQIAARAPDLRVLNDRFGVNRVGVVVPKGRTEHLTYFSEFVEEAKASGLVQQAIDRAGLQGVRVADPATVRTK